MTYIRMKCDQEKRRYTNLEGNREKGTVHFDLGGTELREYGGETFEQQHKGQERFQDKGRMEEDSRMRNNINKVMEKWRSIACMERGVTRC